MNFTVVITDWGFPNIDTERSMLEGRGCQVLGYQCKTEDEVVEVVADADLVISQWAPIRERAISAMKKARAIIRYGIGLDNIDVAAARAQGITVRNIPDYCLDEVADHTLALLLSLQRQVVTVWSRVQSAKWINHPPLELPPLAECTLGLIGFGHIAQRVARRAKAFGTAVIACDPYQPDETFTASEVRGVPLQELYSRSDLISLHCPLVEQTRHMISRDSLAQMHPHTLLVNTSRGGLVATDDLLDALQDEVIAGAALDVVEEEPLPASAPILKAPNIIVTSHIAWYSSKSIGRLQRRVAEEALSILHG
jgi:D-3-phosphoglycerate dehydrogenase / 2-oxoglutarate reductase